MTPVPMNARETELDIRAKDRGANLPSKAFGRRRAQQIPSRFPDFVARCRPHAPRSVRALVELVSFAAGRLHQPADAVDRARTRRARLEHHRSRQRAFAHRKKSARAQAGRFGAGRPADGDSAFRQRAGRDARRGRDLSGIGRAGGRHQHGLPREKSRQDRWWFRDDDRTRQDRGAGSRHDRGRENPRDRKDAARLGQRQPDGAGPRARFGRHRRRRGFCARAHACPGLCRHGQPRGHPLGRGGGEIDSGDRQR